MRLGNFFAKTNVGDPQDFIFVPKAMLYDNTLTPMQKLVFIHLYLNENEEHSISSLARTLGKSNYGIRTAIKALAEKFCVALELLSGSKEKEQEKEKKKSMTKRKKEKEEEKETVYTVDVKKEKEKEKEKEKIKEEERRYIGTQNFKKDEVSACAFAYSRENSFQLDSVGYGISQVDDTVWEQSYEDLHQSSDEQNECYVLANQKVYNSRGYKIESFDITPTPNVCLSEALLPPKEKEKPTKEKEIEETKMSESLGEIKNTPEINARGVKIENNSEGATEILPKQKNELKSDYSNVLEWVDNLDYESKPLEFWKNIMEREVDFDEYKYFLKPYKPKDLVLTPKEIDELVEQVEYTFTCDGYVIKRPTAQLRKVILEMLEYTNPAHIFFIAHDVAWSFICADKYEGWNYESMVKDFNYITSMTTIASDKYYGKHCDYVHCPRKQVPDEYNSIEWAIARHYREDMQTQVQMIMNRSEFDNYFTCIKDYVRDLTRYKRDLYHKDEVFKLYYEYSLAKFNECITPKYQAIRDKKKERGEIH